MVLVYRPVKDSDLKHVLKLAEVSGVGVTSLPSDRQALEEKISFSCDCFKKVISHPENELYLFVLEDTEKKEVIGTSAIFSKIGMDKPFYSYKVSTITNFSEILNFGNHYKILHLVNDYRGCSELATLFLAPAYRHHNNGLFLSLARFLFMAQFPERFEKKMIAELRGVSSPEGNSPFWDAVGRYFFQMDFGKADYLSAVTDKRFIAEMMPKQAIYVHFLPKLAQDVIGKPHIKTVPAYKILMREGFRFHDYVDIFDAGPTIEAWCEDIKTINNSKIYKSVAGKIDSSLYYFVSNLSLDFRALCISTEIKNEEYAVLSPDAINVLQIKEGDPVRIVQVQK